ncbi:terpene cyclase [Penicillium capsulatum]|uniref:Terpene cyclase n=1 Tax=Penicillium capsulatum TaxID=69766 RepID=A0A9W9HMN2_9EURO|nr:terpene cyclase [Penicillium capsulatum]KAJ6112532.1 terpene cyclase [Penicillium capsulatum]
MDVQKSTGNTDSLDNSSFLSQVEHALNLSIQHATTSIREDGHWCGELKSNVTITADISFFGKPWNSDGSWGLAPGCPGDVSTTIEAYLVLKILGIQPDSPVMQNARHFAVRAGALPQLPVELFLLPSVLPITIYQFSSWARGTIVPLLFICHHQPTYALSNGGSTTNDYLDEVWVDATTKNVCCGPSLQHHLEQRDFIGLGYSIFDKLLYQLNGCRSAPFLRPYARSRCMKWILERQEPTGDWGGIFPPMHGSIFAFLLEGYKLDDAPVCLGIQAIENFAWEDENGKRIQSYVSPL